MEKTESCGRLLKQINDELRKNANNAMRSQNMTMAQLEALVTLDQMPEKQMSLKELEQTLHVAQSTAAGIVVRLEQKGLAEGFGDANDRRIKKVRITPAGKEHVLCAKQNAMEAEDKLLASLTATEREIFFVLLQKVRNSLK